MANVKLDKRAIQIFAKINATLFLINVLMVPSASEDSALEKRLLYHALLKSYANSPDQMKQHVRLNFFL